jgi:hypothetical protein
MSVNVRDGRSVRNIACCRTLSVTVDGARGDA